MTEKSKRIQILQSAEKIMAVKGLDDSSIAEIAKNAGVTESIIYQYFKGKEDLLLSIPGERMKDVIANLEEHLQGIKDPESRLRKMIWFHLYYNDTHKEYTRLFQLECRANKNFYNHESYNLIRKYSGIMMSILEDGVKEKSFRPDINMRLVRDIILGTLEWENLTCLASNEIAEASPDLEDIMTFISPMITTRTVPTEIGGEKSYRILRAADKVFAEKGYHRATITQIAKLAGVSEGTIYEYYKNKEDLLFSICDLRFKEHMSALKEVFEIKTPVRKLRRFIRYHFHLFLNEPNFLKNFLLHIQFNVRFFKSHLYSLFQDYLKTLDLILEDGKKEGNFRIDVNNRVFKNLFLGAFSHIALRWFVVDSEKAMDIFQEINEAASLLSLAVLNIPSCTEHMSGLEGNL